MLMIKYSHLRVENDPQKVKCYDEEEYIHPPINREKMVVRIFIRNVWKVAFEQWIERLQHIYLSAVVE